MAECLEKIICTSVFMQYIDNFAKIVSPQPLGTLIRDPENNKCVKYDICLDRVCNMVTALLKNTIPNTLGPNSPFANQLPLGAIGVYQVYLNACTCDVQNPFIDPACPELFCWQPKSILEGKRFSFLACGPLVTALCGIPIIDPLSGDPQTTLLQVILPSDVEGEEQRICIRPKDFDDTFEPFTEDDINDLTNDISDITPEWSPNARSVLFSRTTTGILRTDAFGNMQEVQLTSNVADAFPQWSPNGCNITFERPDGGNVHIWTSDAMGNMNELQLTVADGVVDSNPQYSPDGQQIAFSREAVAGSGIFVINANTPGSEMPLTTNMLDITPQWSPDGTKIVFARTMGNTDGGIFVVDINTMLLTQLFQNSATEFGVTPQWSPDGTRVVFARANALAGPGLSEIVVTDAEGNMTELTTGNVDETPQFSPEGSKVVFARTDANAGEGGIIIVSSTGGPLMQLTTDATDITPQWSPAGDRIVFSDPSVGIQAISLGRTWDGQLSDSVAATWIALPLELCNV